MMKSFLGGKRDGAMERVDQFSLKRERHLVPEVI